MSRLKNILCFGTKNKADILMYLGAMLRNMNKKVLIIDMTKGSIYKHSFSADPDMNLIDFDGVDILLDVSNHSDVENVLSSYKESLEAYDIVIFDVDDISVLQENEWNEIFAQYYVGDFDLMNQKLDAVMIDYLADNFSDRFQRLTFESKYQVSLDAIEAYIKSEINWISIHYSFESDEAQEGNKIKMQHEKVIPINGLCRQHKKMLTEIISFMFEVPNSDITNASSKLSKWLPGRKQKALY